jgi:hypothetical protein
VADFRHDHLCCAKLQPSWFCCSYLIYGQFYGGSSRTQRDTCLCSRSPSIHTQRLTGTVTQLGGRRNLLPPSSGQRSKSLVPPTGSLRAIIFPNRSHLCRRPTILLLSLVHPGPQYGSSLSPDPCHSPLTRTIFWDIATCSPLKLNRRFGGTYRLHLQLCLPPAFTLVSCSA